MIALSRALLKRTHRITHQPNIEVELTDILCIAFQPRTKSISTTPQREAKTESPKMAAIACPFDYHHRFSHYNHVISRSPDALSLRDHDALARHPFNNMLSSRCASRRLHALNCGLRPREKPKYTATKDWNWRDRGEGWNEREHA